MNTLELLEVSGQLIKAIDDCTDWFLLYVEEKNPVQKRLFETVYESKCKKCQEVAEDAYERLS